MKILTILIPVYNTEKYIKRCLDSILLKEIINDIEILVVSDGSKDDSVNIVKEYRRKYPDTIKLIEKENGGHGSTINKGLELATGKYFRVLDSDDWFKCVDFIKFVQKLKKETADLVVTNYRQIHVYDQHESIYIYKNLVENKVYYFDDIDLNILNGEYFVMATSTYKLDILKNSKLCLLEKTFYVDMQYNIEPIKEVQTFVYYNLDVYRYYIGRKNQSVNIDSFVKNKLSHEKVLKYLIEYYKNIKSKISKVKRDYLEMILIYLLNTHYTIFCVYDKNQNETYSQIVEFDKYFMSIDRDLYEKSNKVAFIRYHRKTNFKFVKIKNKMLKKSFNYLYNLRNRLRRKRLS